MVKAGPLDPKLIDFSLDTVDAAMKLVCRDWPNLWHTRLDELAGKLIVYRIADESRTHCLGDCGEIRLQFHAPAQVRLSIVIDPCTEEDVFRYYAYKHSRAAVRIALAERGAGIQKEREVFLAGLCERLLENMAVPTLPFVDSPRPTASQAGKPALPLEEAILRIALALLEKYLKEQDAGMTRGEVVILAREKLGILTTINNVKDGRQRLGDAEWNKDEELLAGAQDQVQAWLTRLSP
jgi:hypothetical protein